jgi:hypothetical protein
MSINSGTLDGGHPEREPEGSASARIDREARREECRRMSSRILRGACPSYHSPLAGLAMAYA